VFSRSKKSLCGRKKERSCTLTVSHSRSHTHGLTLTVNTHGDAHSRSHTNNGFFKLVEALLQVHQWFLPAV